MKNKKGISLIVLVITVIIMIILIGAILLSVNNQRIIGKAESTVEEYNLEEVQALAELEWSDAYMKGARTQEELEQKTIEGLKSKKGVDLSAYSVTVTEFGATVVAIPVDWRDNVTAIVEGVPVPKGFVVSKATGENTKASGLVIYEGTETVTDVNVETAKRARNQYVWVPVDNFDTDFIRRNTFGSRTLSNTLGTSSAFWEVEVNASTNVPLTAQSVSYMTPTTLQEVQAMYKSVEQYGGFYIARYETGIDSQRKSDNGTLVSKVYSVMGKIPYTFIPWAKENNIYTDTNGAVQVARSLYKSADANYGAVSTLTYGVQWDSVIEWWINTNAITSVEDSGSYGNYRDDTITSTKLNANAKYAVLTGSSNLSSYEAINSSITKPTDDRWLLTTGALKVAKVNNIYDMAGNVREWTMEGYGASQRSCRGGNFGNDGDACPVGRRDGIDINTTSFNLGFRTSLYVKF